MTNEELFKAGERALMNYHENKKSSPSSIFSEPMLTIKTVTSSLVAKIRNIFTSKKVLYLVEISTRYEVEPTWRIIQENRDLSCFKLVQLNIPNWSKELYAYRIQKSYNIPVKF